MKVLVTGGAGFIGSHTVQRLLADNSAVVVLDNLSTGRLANVPAGVRLEKLDIAADDLLPFMAAERFDGVIHLAAQTMVSHSLAEPTFDANVNILATVKLLGACRQTGVRRLIFSSSAAVYGDAAGLPLSEEMTGAPTSFYGLSKLTVERYCRLFYELFGLEYIVLRYANVYGERQGDGGEGGVISIFARRLAAGQPIDIFGDGSQTRDFIYAGDVAAANCRALVTPVANAVYNISTGRETSVNELVGLMAKAVGRTPEVRYQPVRTGDIYRSALANTAATAALSWQPVTALADGLTATCRALVKPV